MTIASLRELSDAEIHKRLEETRQELFTLRLQRAAGKLTNPARIPLMRRTLAHLLTVRRERAAGGSPGTLGRGSRAAGQGRG